MRTPGIENWNVNVVKRIKIGESRQLELRTEFYNILNHPQFTSGSVSPFSPGDQGVGATVIGTAAGRFLVANFADGGGRVVRYQIKFIF